MDDELYTESDEESLQDAIETLDYLRHEIESELPDNLRLQCQQLSDNLKELKSDIENFFKEE